MKTKTMYFLAAVTACLFFTNSAQAEVTLNAARVGAVDVPALAEFYKTAFGLHEVNRLEFPGVVEIMLNSGADADAARANRNAQVVIMSRESDEVQDAVPHLIFSVTDINAAAASVKDAGGKLDGDPQQFGDSGIFLVFGADPAGNRFELLQFPAQ